MTTKNIEEVTSEEITLSEVYIEYPGEAELKKAKITVGWDVYLKDEENK